MVAAAVVVGDDNERAVVLAAAGDCARATTDRRPTTTTTDACASARTNSRTRPQINKQTAPGGGLGDPSLYSIFCWTLLLFRRRFCMMNNRRRAAPGLHHFTAPVLRLYTRSRTAGGWHNRQWHNRPCRTNAEFSGFSTPRRDYTHLYAAARALGAGRRGSTELGMPRLV